MKIASFLAVSALALSINVQAADDHKGHAHDAKGAEHAHEVKPQHGGVVSVVKDVNYELVTSPEGIALYVSDHGKASDLTGGSAKLTLLSGTKKTEATLAPAKDALRAQGAFNVPAGTKVVAQVTLKGQAAQPVRFTTK